jgi:Na+/H+ antiporter NhaD/arsenite permease-like protein
MRFDAAVPLAIFLLTYVVLALGALPPLRLDRAGAALTGAVAMVVSGALSAETAERAIDYPTLMLLLGMMIVVANLRLSGAFALLARRLLTRAHGPLGLLAATIALGGFLAAFFVNDVVCLVLTPVVLETTAALGLDAVPFLLALATAANIGSTATITGNPQNMIVAGFAKLDYLGFAARLAPVAVVGLVIDYAVIALLYRGRLARRPDARPASVGRRLHVLRPLLRKSAAISLGALVGFGLGFPTHLVPLTAGALLLFTRRIRPERVYADIDWTMLLMFAGLFIVVQGAEETGLQRAVLAQLGPARLAHPLTLAGATVILSNLFSNVPAILLFRPLYPLLGGGQKPALLLASVSTLAGNLTVLASIANLIVIEQAKRRGVHVSFLDYLKVGLPVTVLTLAIDLVWLQVVA